MTKIERYAASARPGLSAVQIGVMIVTIGMITMVMAIGLGGTDVLNGLIRRLPNRSMRTIPTSQTGAADAPGPRSVDMSKLIGRWRSQDGGARLIVTGKGEVWSDVGMMQGSALPVRTGANFSFGNGTFFCAYELTFTDETTADWRLVDRSAGTSCPHGLFSKPASL